MLCVEPHMRCGLASVAASRRIAAEDKDCGPAPAILRRPERGRSLKLR